MSSDGTTTSGLPGEESASDEALFDRFIDLALRGTPPDPREFLRAAGRGDAHELLVRLEGLARAAGRGAAGRARAGELPFDRLGPYRLIRRIGRGGMGLVFLAEDETLGRQVAIKLVRPELAGSPAAAERFEREARAVARLRHPHVVTLHAVGREGQTRYLVMERLDGRGLDELIDEARAAGSGLRVADVLRWGVQLAGALHYAHEHGVVHRDVKPGNVRIAADGRAVLLDFGVARDLGAQASTLGNFVGSLPYAAPEQVDERQRLTDGRTDVYGLGITLYEALTGRRPFDGGTTEQLLRAVLQAQPRAPREHLPGLPRAVQTVLLKALEKEPANRYATAGALADDLQALLEFRPIAASPPSRVRRLVRVVRRRPAIAAAAVTALVALAAVGGLRWRDAQKADTARRSEARRLLDDARTAVDGFDQRQARLESLETDVAQLERDSEGGWTTPAEDERLLRTEDEAADLRRERTSFVYETLDRLQNAERIAGALDGADAVRARLYEAMWKDAGRRGDAREADVWRRLVEQADPGGAVAVALAAAGTLDVTVDPPDARLELYRYEDLSTIQDGGEPRLVPVPAAGAPPVPPGSFALRVCVDCPPLRAGDHIVELCGFPLRDLMLLPDVAARVASIDGRSLREPYDLDRARDDRAGRQTFSTGRSDPWAPAVRPSGPVHYELVFADGRRETREAPELEPLLDRVLSPVQAAAQGGLPARVAHDGVLLDMTLPAGTEAVLTAAPTIAPEESRLQPGSRALSAGNWLVRAIAPGRAEARAVFCITGGSHVALRFDLPRADLAPPGFVYVASGAVPPELQSPSNPYQPSFWLMRREVTCAEWADFLDDPEVAARMGPDPPSALVPRVKGRMVCDPLWQRDARGRWHWPPDGRPDRPVMGISLLDARAYAAWLTARARAAGRPITYVVPTWTQWFVAAMGCAPRRFVYGDRFRPKWSASCFARPLADPEPCMSHPIDEATCGAYDMNGSAFEWVDYYDEPRSLWRVMGGAWGEAAAGLFDGWGGLGLLEDASTTESGLRLALTVDG